MAKKHRGGKKGPCQRRSREMVAAIVEASARVFSKHGFEAATTNEIAEQAGASIGSLYQYFPNKLALLFAVNERHHIRLLTQAAAACRSGYHLPWPYPVRNLVEAVVGHVTRDLAIVEIVLRELPMDAMYAPESILTSELAAVKAEHDRDLRNLLTVHRANITVRIEEAVYMIPVIGKGAFTAILVDNPEYLLNGKLTEMVTEMQLKYLTAPQQSDASSSVIHSAMQNLV